MFKYICEAFVTDVNNLMTNFRLFTFYIYSRVLNTTAVI